MQKETSSQDREKSKYLYINDAGKTKPFPSLTRNNVYKPQKKHDKTLLIYFHAGMMTGNLISLEKSTVNKKKKNTKICLGNHIKKKIVKFGERREAKKKKKTDKPRIS